MKSLIKEVLKLEKEILSTLINQEDKKRSKEIAKVITDIYKLFTPEEKAQRIKLIESWKLEAQEMIGSDDQDKIIDILSEKAKEYAFTKIKRSPRKIISLLEGREKAKIHLILAWLCPERDLDDVGVRGLIENIVRNTVNLVF